VTIVGFTLTNCPWRSWTEKELQAVLDLEPRVVQVLVYKQQPESIRQAQKQQLLWIYSVLGCKFQYRICGFGPGDSPEEAAQKTKEFLRGLPPGKIIPFNEPNHPGEGWTNFNWASWARSFALCFDYFEGYELITPALSPNFPGYDSDVRNILAPLVDEGVYDYLGLHIYAETDLSSLQELPCIITECNGDLPHKVFNWPNAEEIIWFSLLWENPGEENWKWDLLNNKELSDSFKSWKEETTVPEFKFGVLDEANRLRAAGVDVGEPITDEYWFTRELAVQLTTTGQFWVHRVGDAYYVQFHLKSIVPLA